MPNPDTDPRDDEAAEPVDAPTRDVDPGTARPTDDGRDDRTDAEREATEFGGE
ncbi:hypothetical protein GCM10010472_53250 [Pseudonocardia halophobica]|uniref:Uncharacterized protein n=1 Tax=Pseudonocardia halophobica TaxID=29401 RepID=A0A9W6NW49_9PSEU|nr:hypothetical protein [Pseudonocardia halophobica]GLL12010.1 hypothetical protein GCM10017577_31510 [Pseudonocardia halophobica]